MLKSGHSRAALVAALWIGLVLGLLAGVGTGPIATVWSGVLVLTGVLTGKWAADWVRWRRDRGAGRWPR